MRGVCVCVHVYVRESEKQEAGMSKEKGNRVSDFRRMELGQLILENGRFIIIGEMEK